MNRAEIEIAFPKGSDFNETAKVFLSRPKETENGSIFYLLKTIDIKTRQVYSVYKTPFFSNKGNIVNLVGKVSGYYSLSKDEFADDWEVIIDKKTVSIIPIACTKPKKQSVKLFEIE